MKIKYYLFASLCGAMTLGFTACSDDMTEGGGSTRPQGRGIVFGVSSDKVETRTIYGDYTNGDDGKPISQELLWEADDRVEIYSPQSPSLKQVEYGIGNIDQQDQGKAYLAAINGQNGLQWAGSGTQDFYAVYPSKASMTNQGIANQYVSFTNGVLTGFIPINQQHEIYKENGKWVAKPNMDWQYMAACNKNFTVPTDGTDGGVSLQFHPLVTTLEITIVGSAKSANTPLSQMNIEAPEGTTIMGAFQCDLNNWDGIGVPACVSTQTGTVTNYVTVSLYDRDGAPIVLAEGDEITFNVFLLPVENLTDLAIRVAGFNTASRTLELKNNGTPITLEAHKKTRVRIPAPEIGTETNEWLGGINDDVLLTQLSIPGTANSFSYMYDGDYHERFRTQTATIQEQWNAGIRCFELVCSEGNGSSLASAPLLCNRQQIGESFGDAVNTIWQLVRDHPSEFAIIIPSYDSNTGHPSDHNGVANFANRLNQFYDEHSNYNYKTFTRETTVGEARGNLLFIARITSEEDEGYTLPTPHQGTFVDQWGSLNDNWMRRGYATESGNPVHNWSTGENDQNSVEYYLHTNTTRDYGDTNTGNISAPVPDFVPTRTLPTNFKHATQREGGTTGTAYIQDWKRVVPREDVVDGLRPGQFYLGDTNSGWRTYHHYFYWPESLTEKEGDVWDTFLGAIEHNKAEAGGGSMFYINSLDGYFVDPSIPLSYAPYLSSGSWGFSYIRADGQSVGLSAGGTEGNIVAYANYINGYFYRKILVFGVANIYGPMNIVLMDYVYDGTDGGDRLPSTIINNNYRFPLLVKGGGTTTNSSDASYSEGGTVWR